MGGGLPPPPPPAALSYKFLFHFAAGNPQPAKLGSEEEMHVLPVPLSLITGMGSMRINVPEDLRPLENRRAALNTLRVSVNHYMLPTLKAEGSGPYGLQ